MTEAPEAPEAESVVLYRTDGPIPVITMNRPEYRIAHAHNAEVQGDSLGGQTINSLKRS